MKLWFRRFVFCLRCILSKNYYRVPEVDSEGEICSDGDKIGSLYWYLKGISPHCSAEDWYYDQEPVIVRHINSFSPKECDNFLTRFLVWDEETLYRLADALIEISNPNLNGSYLYALVFLKIRDDMFLEYLVENIQVIHSIPEGSHPISFYLELRNKISTMEGKIWPANYVTAMKSVESKIEAEGSNCL